MRPWWGPDFSRIMWSESQVRSTKEESCRGRQRGSSGRAEQQRSRDWLSRACLAGCGGGSAGTKRSAGPGSSDGSTTSRPASGSSSTPSGVSSDLTSAHGIFVARCTTDHDAAGNEENVYEIDVRDPRDGHVVASKAFRTPFGSSPNPVVFGDPLSLALCGQSPQRSALDANYEHVVASAHLADGSEHAGMLDLSSDKFTDLRAGAVKGALAPVVHDGPAQFGPDGQIWFGETEGSSDTDFKLVSVDPSTLTATVRLDHVQQDLVNTTSVPTLTAKAKLIVAKPPVGYPPAAFCNCAPVPNPSGDAAVQVDAAGISVFLPPVWHRQIIELAAGRDFGGQKWNGRTELAWLDDQRFVCTCVGSSGGVGLALVTMSPSRSGITVVPLLPDTDRVSHDVMVAPNTSGIAFISTGHGEDALFTVSPKGGDAARLVALPADSHVLEWR